MLSRMASFISFLLFPLNQALAVHPVLQNLLDPHPHWQTLSFSSADPTGGNGDGNGLPLGRDDNGDAILFSHQGEGVITRLWMTAPHEGFSAPRDWESLKIIVDGSTLFEGPPLDFFEGRGPFQFPLVLAFEASSGAYLSVAPIAFTRFARITLKGKPHYFQVNATVGQGASRSVDLLSFADFLSQDWTQAPVESAQFPIQGPLLITRIRVQLKDLADFSRLEVTWGNQSVPASLFFGRGLAFETEQPHRVESFQSALHSWNPEASWVETRLPIPLLEAQTLLIRSMGTTTPWMRLWIETEELPKSRPELSRAMGRSPRQESGRKQCSPHVFREVGRNPLYRTRALDF
jgi:hypothetical protein